MWHALIRYPQGMNPNSKRRCQQCVAWSEQRTKRNKKHGQKILPPRLLGTGLQAGGSPILSTRLKDGMTTDSTGQPVPWWFDIYLRKESQQAENSEFLSWINRLQLTAVYCHRRGVWMEYILNLIDIHEHFIIHKGYGTMRTSSRTTSTTLGTLWPIAWTPQCTLTRTLRSSEHAAHRL